MIYVEDRQKIDRLIEIIDLINDGKWDKIHMTMYEAFHLKDFLRRIKDQ